MMRWSITREMKAVGGRRSKQENKRERHLWDFPMLSAEKNRLRMCDKRNLQYFVVCERMRIICVRNATNFSTWMYDMKQSTFPPSSVGFFFFKMKMFWISNHPHIIVRQSEKNDDDIKYRTPNDAGELIKFLVKYCFSFLLFVSVAKKKKEDWI